MGLCLLNEHKASPHQVISASEAFDWPSSFFERVTPQPDPPVAEFSEIAAAVRRSWRILAIWMAFCALVAAWYLHVTPSQYTASATVILEPSRPDAAAQNGATVNYTSDLNSEQVESQIEVIQSERLLRSVFDTLGLNNARQFSNQKPGLRETILNALGLSSGDSDVKLDASARSFQAFRDGLSVRRVGESYVVEISYQADTPKAAVRITNAITSAYILSQVNEHGREYLQERISNIKTEQQAALEGVRKGEIPSIDFPDSDARVIGAALPPLSRSSPQTTLVMAFAIILGALSGLFGVAIWRALDRTLTTRQQVRRILGLDCLGVVPNASRLKEMRNWPKDSFLGCAVLTAPLSRFAAAARAARTSIFMSFARSGGPTTRRVVGIASWSPGEGRSTLAASLAYFIASSGESVTLVDADLGNPSLTATLAPSATYGLDEALLNREIGRDLPICLSDTLSFIPAVGAGRTGEPNVYFGSDEMRALLAGLRAEGDVVLDLPPLNMSADALAVAPLLDGVVLLVEASRTTATDAAEAIWALYAANARVLGVVLNKAAPNYR
jgi:polysaccharide biosynthesis transport protein